MRKLIPIILLLLTISGCSDDDCGCAPPESSIAVSVRDIEGNYIDVQNAFPDFGVTYEHFPNNLDPVMPWFFTHNTIPMMEIFLNNNKIEQQPVTYLRFSDVDIDTLRSEFKGPKLRKIWLNGVLQDISSTGYIIIYK